MLLSTLLSPYTLLVIPITYYLLPYIRFRAIRDIPAPFPAAFSNLWLLYQCRRGRRYLAVDSAHKKYGLLVRIQPDHISVADASAIPVIYSHTGGWTKRYSPFHPMSYLSDEQMSYPTTALDVYSQLRPMMYSNYYDAFVSIQRGLFNTRDRAEHTRKRKTVSYTFSAKSISQFEQYMTSNLQDLRQQWNRLSDTARNSGQEYAEIDSLQWFNYLAFDIIGDLVSIVIEGTNRLLT